MATGARSASVLSCIAAPENPGLVLGLDRGGACRSMAFRVAPEKWHEVIGYLRARELVTNVYLERHLPLQLPDGRSARAVAYVVDRAHEQYAGALDIARRARSSNVSVGQSGLNDAYRLNTLAHLKEMGIRDQWLEQVVEEVTRLRARHPLPKKLSPVLKDLAIPCFYVINDQTLHAFAGIVSSASRGLCLAQLGWPYRRRRQRHMRGLCSTVSIRSSSLALSVTSIRWAKKASGSMPGMMGGRICTLK